MASISSRDRALKASNLQIFKRGVGGHPYAAVAVGAAASLGLAAFANWRLAISAEKENPSRGHFIEIGGVHLHVVERGHGEPLVLLHGNGSMVEDFISSGLVDMAASRYRVIAIDRPGHGHTRVPVGAHGPIPPRLS